MARLRVCKEVIEKERGVSLGFWQRLSWTLRRTLNDGREREDLEDVEMGGTSGFQDSWRKAALQCTINYGTFVKRRATTFLIVPRIKEIFFFFFFFKKKK
jgi:hypothetical protein